MSKLTNRQRVFVELYLTIWNATEAARQAGYSQKTANQQGPRLLVNVGVKSEIERRLIEKTATVDEVLERLTAHSRGNMADFLNDYGLIDIDKARAAQKLQLVKKIIQRTTRVSKKNGDEIERHRIDLELYDAQAATVQLGRALGAFNADKSGAPGVVINNLAVIGVQPVEYRNGLDALAPLESGSIPDSDAPGADEGTGDGAALGQNDPGGSAGIERIETARAGGLGSPDL